MPLTRSAYLTWKESIIPVQNGGCCVVSWDLSHKQTHSVKTAAIHVFREQHYFSDCREVAYTIPIWASLLGDTVQLEALASYL